MTRYFVVVLNGRLSLSDAADNFTELASWSVRGSGHAEDILRENGYALADRDWRSHDGALYRYVTK